MGGNSLFDPAIIHFSGCRSVEEFGPVDLGLDVYETNAEYVIRAPVPGVDPKDVEISVNDEVLTIKGESRHEDEVTEEHYPRKELRVGSFQRSLRLPPTIDAEKATATLEHRVLRLSIPKKPEARPKSIKIVPVGRQRRGFAGILARRPAIPAGRLSRKHPLASGWREVGRSLASLGTGILNKRGREGRSRSA